MEQYFGLQGRYTLNTYEVLKKLGVPAKVHGYHYILEAIVILMNNEEAVYSLMREVYRPIACRHRMNCKNIESAIRTAIRVSWETGNYDLQEAIFGYSRLDQKKPCNSEYIFRIVEYLKNGNNSSFS